MITATYVDHCGNDLTTVNAARVSFGKESEWEYGEDGTHYLSYKDAKLIKYLAEHNHFSPFGHAFASFRVKAPIFVARQLVKHQYLRWNEISRRYVDDEPEFYMPKVWRGRSEDKKQGSDGVVNLTDLNSFGDEFQGNFGEIDLASQTWDVMFDVKDLYEKLVQVGVAPEMARMVLPQSTMTEWFWSGSLDAFADMAKLRYKEDTQYETRLVADQISEKMKQLFPVSWEALIG
jgi:thymidylate synthase (FAD)